MNEDPKYWEEVVLPWIQGLKAKQEEARVKLLELEAVAYSKAGYVKVQGRFFKKEDKVAIKNWSDINFWKERRRYYDPKSV